MRVNPILGQMNPIGIRPASVLACCSKPPIFCSCFQSLCQALPSHSHAHNKTESRLMFWSALFSGGMQCPGFVLARSRGDHLNQQR